MLLAAHGFIGSNLVDTILSLGKEVTVYDNFSTGIQEYLETAEKRPGFHLKITGDLLDQEKLCTAMAGCDFVFHLAANADVRYGTEHRGKRSLPEYYRNV